MTAPVTGSGRGGRLSGNAIIAIACLGVTGFLLVNLALMPFDTDQAVFAMMGERILHGGVPYRDIFDIKPPGIFLIYTAAQALMGPGDLAIRLFEVLSWLAMGGAFWILSRRAGDGRAAPLCLVLAVHGMMLSGYWNTGQAETYAAVLLGWAIVAATPRGTAGFRHWLAAAALYTAAGLLKPTLGAGILASFAVAAHQSLKLHGRAGLWRPVAAHLLGGLAVMLSVGVHLVASGAWPSFAAAILDFLPRYAAANHGRYGLDTLMLLALGKFGLLWMAVAGGWFLHALLGRRMRRDLRIELQIWAIVVAALTGVALQAKFFEYHFATAVAIGALPAGWGYWALWTRLPRGALSGLGLAAVILALALALPDARPMWRHGAERIAALWQTPEAMQGRFPAMRFEPGMEDDTVYRLAKWLRAAAPDGRASGLYLFGYRPALYFYSGLRPASRYLFNLPQRVPWSREAARAELMAELSANRPWAIVVQSNDAEPLVTGSQADSRSLLQDFPALLGLLEAEYRLTIRFTGFDVYTRRPDGAMETVSRGSQ